MKRIYRHLFIVLLVLSSVLTAQGNDPLYIQFRQYCSETDTDAPMVELPEKTQRTSSQSADFIVNYPEEIPDSIQNAFDMAIQMWSVHLKAKSPILLTIEFAELEDDVVFLTETLQYIKNGHIYPVIYDKLYGGTNENEAYHDDGIITFNSNLKYNCSFNAETNDDGYNLLTQTLRAIARCFGFCSNIKLYNNKICFNNMPSLYDEHLFCDDVCLADLTPSHDNLHRFATSENVMFKTSSKSFPVYAPSEFKEGNNLNFLKVDDTLMSYKIGNGAKFFDIDNTTLEVLNSLGYQFSNLKNLKIVSSELGETGVGSAFIPHTFSAKYLGPGHPTSTFDWSFYLKDKDDLIVEVEYGSGDTFTISPIKDPEAFKRNINGDLEGYITLGCYANNKFIYSQPYKLSLELEPLILSVSDFDYHKLDSDSYQLSLKVSYRGADNLQVHLWEEGDVVVREQNIKEPVLAHVQTGAISNLFDNYIELIAKNKYGKTSHLINLSAGSANQKITYREQEPSHLYEKKYDIYSINGEPLQRCVSTKVLSQLRPGAYVLVPLVDGKENRRVVYVR